jgi:putative CocE/NonD family hydrolase
MKLGGGSGQRNADGRLDHGDHWRDEKEWPLARTQPACFYLHRDGRLSPCAPTASDQALSYDFDPADPVPTIGGAIMSSAPLMYAGAYDQVETVDLFGATAPGRPLANRPDVLVFETAPLDAEVELTGSIAAHLHISSTAVDTDFTIKLVDVYPPNADYPEGYAMNLAHGILRTRFRTSFETPEAMEPGTIYELDIPTFPKSNRFLPGHRIRIEVSSSNFPHFDVNPNIHWRVPDAKPQVARNTIHVDRNHPSYVVLPVIL